jgi:hypothetical protein
LFLVITSKEWEQHRLSATSFKGNNKKPASFDNKKQKPYGFRDFGDTKIIHRKRA